jgi:hypothetical protein
VNAKVDTRDGSNGLRQVMDGLTASQPQPAWVGYTVPASPGANLGCDSWYHDGDFRSGGGTVHLEPASEALILFRVAENRVQRVRVLAPDCNIDAGGVPFHWLTGVRPADSVAVLRGMDSALSAIAAHAAPEADATLEELTAATQTEAVRSKAVSYLGRRGDRGIGVLRRILTQDTSDRVRERAVQSLGNTKRRDAIDLVTATARNDRSPKVRGQALMTLGRQTGVEASATLREAIESDPDREVKRRALSAFRHMPDNTGVPALIELARNSRNPEVRKEAMVHLGQTKDPRAFAFFEQVLKP